MTLAGGTCGEAKSVAHVFYVHSPITYSMALATIEHLHLSEPVIVGGRCMAGSKISCTVTDDGIWSIDRTAELFRSIAACIPIESSVSLYLPHTAFLFGKLIKLSRRVERIIYLEEGYTSAQAQLLGLAMAPTQVAVAELTDTLESLGLVDAWQMDRARMAYINILPDSFFDVRCPQYSGAYACSADAFIGMPSVTHLALPVARERRTAQLLSFFAISNRYSGEILEVACQYAIELIQKMHCAQGGRPLIVKLHPMDYANLPVWFQRELVQRGLDYFSDCCASDIDPNIEPALLNFDHYHIVGRSAQAKYVQQFLGRDRMTQY
jgi:hypothetical protein